MSSTSVAEALISLKRRNYGDTIALAGRAIDAGKAGGADDRLLSLAYLIRASAYLSTRVLSEAEADIGQALERDPLGPFRLWVRARSKDSFRPQAPTAVADQSCDWMTGWLFGHASFEA